MDWKTAVKNFVIIVEAGSLAEAARLRYTSSSALSKQLGWLEDRLKTQLLHRTTRHLSLTESGQLFYVHAKRILDDIQALENQVSTRSDELSGQIRITCRALTQQSMLLQLIPGFLAKHPKISIELNVSPREQDLANEGYDFAVRCCYSKNQNNMEQVLLGSIKIDVYGSPDYFKKHGEPQKPEDLVNHNCLIHTGIDTYGRWEFADKEQVSARGSFGSSSSKEYVSVRGSFSSNSSGALIEAARKGLGLIQISDDLILQDVIDGHLVPVLQKYSGFCNDIYGVYPKQAYPNKNVLALISFLQEHKFCSLFCQPDQQ